jgi:acetate kinase
MTMVLVLNSGSSSVKFAVFDVLQGAAGAINPVCTGNASRLNEPGAGEFRLEWQGQKEQLDLPRNDHEGAIDTILSRVRQLGLLQQVAVVGHRVVHGGDRYRAPTRVDDKVLADIESFSAFAPLHNPPNLIGIRVCQQRLPAIPQVAVFDTAFHGTLPPVAYHYAIPQHQPSLHCQPAAAVDAGASRWHPRGVRPPWQRLQSLRDQQRYQRRHQHGLHPAGGPDDGQPQRRSRSRPARISV